MPASKARSLFGLALVLGLGCNRDPTVTHPLPNDAPAMRTAASFVHCVEAGTSLCVKSGENIGGWDAFYLLAMLSGGSPVAIIDALPRELAAHSDPLNSQARFVEEVERYANAIRGAECDPVSMEPLDALIEKGVAGAEARLTDLGLWRRDVAAVVAGLAEEAHEELDGGHLVRMDCQHDPYRVYVAARERDDQFSVVGMTTLLPSSMGGDRPAREMVDDRLHSESLGLADVDPPISDNAINAWLPFPVEVF